MRCRQWLLQAAAIGLWQYSGEAHCHTASGAQHNPKVLPFNMYMPQKWTIYAAASRTQRMPLLLDAESGEFLWRAALR